MRNGEIYNSDEENPLPHLSFFFFFLTAKLRKINDRALGSIMPSDKQYISKTL